MSELYDRDRDVIAYADNYLSHIRAITMEGLYRKNDIASELAWRDAQIETLTKERGEWLDEKLEISGHVKDWHETKKRLEEKIAELELRLDARFTTCTYCQKRIPYNQLHACKG